MLDLDRLRLKTFGGAAGSLFDRNWANRMEDEGYLEYSGGDLSGARYYELTDKGRVMTGEKDDDD